jgi:dTDP-4-amino-4,6-dideoxygalactose transaminase
MIRTRRRIPFGDLGAQYRAIAADLWPALREVVESSSFILGPAVESFERNFARYCGASECVAVGSGTDALHLALLALGVRPGDEVITQANTFMATVEAIAYVGAKPVFVDVKPPEYTIDPAAVRAAVTSRTAAIIPVHFFGQPCDMAAIRAIGRDCGLAIVEDASQAHGAAMAGVRVGASGIATFSFYPGKNLGAYGEGGAVVTSDASLAERMRALRNHGSTQRYRHGDIGYNYRMDGLQGAVLDVKLRYLERWNKGRRRVAAAYDRLLADVSKPAVPANVEHARHLYPVFLDQRDRVREYLEEQGVETNVHYPIPCHLQRACEPYGYRAGDFPHCEFIARSELSLPIYPELSDDDVAYVADAVLAAAGAPC